jgi:hypothetical protein
MAYGNAPQLRNNFDAGLAGLAGAAGGGVAKAGMMISDLGESKLVDAAKKKAMKLEERNTATSEGTLDLTKTKYKDVKLDLEKEKSVSESQKKGKLAAYGPALEEFSKQHPLNTAGMDNDAKLAFAEKITELYKDVGKGYKYNKVWRDEAGNDMVLFSNDKGDTIKKPLGKGFVWNQSSKSVKADKTDGYIQLPSSVEGTPESDNYSSKTSFDGVSGTWVSKDEYSMRNGARKTAEMDLK